MSKKIRTILEITESHIKFMQSKMIRGKRYVVASDVTTIVHGTNQEIIDIFKKLAQVHTIPKDDFTIIIPRKSIIFKRLTLPSDKPQELKKMINLQLISKIPYSLEDVEYSEYIVDKEAVGKSDVLLAIIHKDIIQPVLKYLKEAQMPTPKWSVSSMGLLGWLLVHKSVSGKEGASPTMLLNVDVEQSEICFVKENTLLYSRNLPLGAKDLNEESIHDFIKSIQLSLSTYTNEDMGPTIKQGVIVSEIFDGNLLKEHLEKIYDFPIEIASSLGDMAIAKHKGLQSYEQYQGPSLAVPLGFAITNAAKLWNITPKAVKEGRINKQRQSQFVTFFVLLGILSLLMVSLWLVDFVQGKMHLKHWQQKRQAIEREAKQARETINLVDVFRGDFEQRIFVLDMLTDLNRILPSSMILENIDLDAEDKLTLQGYARNSSDVNKFQSDLSGLAGFKEVNLNFQKKRKIRNEELTAFNLSAQIQKGNK